MPHNFDQGKAAHNGAEVRLLVDLNLEQYVEELFQPFLGAVLPPPPAAPGPVPVENRAPKGQLFALMRQSLANLWERSARRELVTGAPLFPGAQTVTPEPLRPAGARFVRARAAVAAARLPLPPEVREELIELRTEVLQEARTRQLQTLMICGVQPGAGASFVAAQMSRLLAEYAHLKIAFLTVTLNRAAHRLGGNAEAPTRLHLLLQRTEYPNLAEIVSSQGEITLTELLGGCDTAEALRQMKQSFDLIVIDAPALGTAAEAALLAAQMDGVILVAEPHVTPLRRLDRAQQRLRQAQAHVMGIVLNRQRRP